MVNINLLKIGFSNKESIDSLFICFLFNEISTKQCKDLNLIDGPKLFL